MPRLDRIGWPRRDPASVAPWRAVLGEREHREIASALFSDGPHELRPYIGRLLILTALSTLIAALGLIGNQPAVVIGAMLVAPLMQPIVALSAALVSGEVRRVLVSLGLIVLCGLEGVGVAAGVAALVPSFQTITLTPEILSRTAPGLLELGIAVAAGAAGAYVTVRPRAAGALPGAAIAVALMPPLADFGILAERGNSTLAFGAFYLLLTNLVGIVLAAALVFMFLTTGFGDRRDWATHGRAILIPLAVVLAVSYPLGRNTSRTFAVTKDETRVRSVLVPVFQEMGLGLQNLVVVEKKDGLVASVDVIGPRKAPPARELATMLVSALHRSSVSVIVRWTLRDEDTAQAGASDTAAPNRPSSRARSTSSAR